MCIRDSHHALSLRFRRVAHGVFQLFPGARAVLECLRRVQRILPHEMCIRDRRDLHIRFQIRATQKPLHCAQRVLASLLSIHAVTVDVYKRQVLGLLKRTSTEFHQTVVMITHNSEIAQLADRIVRIEDGRIVS